MNIHRFPILLMWIICQQIWVVCGCSSQCSTSIDPGTTGFECSGKTINVCKTFSPSWKVNRLSWDELHLSNCTTGPQAGDQLLLFVSSGKLNYGKYKIVTVKLVNSTRAKKGVRLCHVTLDQPIGMFLVKDQHTCLIAQIFPYFGEVSLRNNCVLTCDEQKDGLGGILAFKARTLIIDQTSKVDMSGKGFHGGTGGDRRGGGGLGGETFFCSAKEPNMGKGGDISGASWANNTNGIGGGGGGDGPETRKGSKGGPGGYNAGGGGADSRANSDDGAAGGGGGGHFSGGGGGGGGSGCGNDGGKGGKAGKIGTNAGGGGQTSCPGGNGGDGGKPGSYPLNKAPHCYDKSAEGGNAGSASHGGGGGDSCGNHFGGGGGGGGLQFGSMDFGSRLSYGGGGGGGGGSAFSVPGGRGGNGGGLVYLQVDELTLDGEILAKGQAGQCLSKRAHRAAPGGSGAGGSVVILTRKLNGNPSRKISISGGDPVKCAFGAGGGGGGGVGRWVVKEGRTVHQG
ncbi:PE-PGRS family protein PE_PGRS26-like isoform X1 [Montipora capricornis]|uniref:PE-PGRS family protein PE_PGRS26-like isoform X1 n=1 Tax=Montipora capricornis TaxID=246305 RepID=UPI0035F1A6A4